MVPFATRLVGRFAYAQESVWTVPAVCISLNLSGLRRWRTRGIDLTEPGPFLSISTPGMVCDFSYGPDRENWVLLGETASIRAGERPGTIDLAVPAEPAEPAEPGEAAEHGEAAAGPRDQAWVTVPALLPLAAEQVPAWQEEFLRLHDAFRDPLPANRLRLHLGLAALLRPFLDHGHARPATPAARLKRLIEEDRACRETIGRLSRRCGLHPDHLRQRFRAAYGLTPLAYRQRCRLALSMDLIGASALSAADIGRRVGFAHASHFSSFLRAGTGMSPRQAIAHYRSGG